MRFIGIIFLVFFLFSCSTTLPEVVVEYVDYTSDLVFPVVPDLAAASVDILTPEEFRSLVMYVVDAEAVFEVIYLRERNMGFHGGAVDE